jgi:SHS2 domain-containing protein
MHYTARVQQGYATFDHTGDLGLEVWAPTPRELYEQAAVALMAQIADPGADPPVERAELSLEGDDPGDLLVHWLNSVLLESDLRHVVWTAVQVHRLTPRRIEATLMGARIDPKRHTLLREVKAVSFHDMQLRLDPGDCRCRLVLDL